MGGADYCCLSGVGWVLIYRALSRYLLLGFGRLYGAYEFRTSFPRTALRLSWANIDGSLRERAKRVRGELWYPTHRAMKLRDEWGTGLLWVS